MNNGNIDPKTILSGALEVLQTEGWQQGKYASDFGHGPYCAVGAINTVVFYGGNTYLRTADNFEYCNNLVNSKKIACEALGRSVRRRFVTIEGWNDDPETTFEDVALAFKQAIYELDQDNPEPSNPR